MSIWYMQMFVVGNGTGNTCIGSCRALLLKENENAICSSMPGVFVDNSYKQFPQTMNVLITPFYGIFFSEYTEFSILFYCPHIIVMIDITQ